MAVGYHPWSWWAAQRLGASGVSGERADQVKSRSRQPRPQLQCGQHGREAVSTHSRKHPLFTLRLLPRAAEISLRLLDEKKLKIRAFFFFFPFLIPEDVGFLPCLLVFVSSLSP